MLLHKQVLCDQGRLGALYAYACEINPDKVPAGIRGNLYTRQLIRPLEMTLLLG